MTFLSVILIAFLIGITYYLYRKKIINKNLFTITSIFIGLYSLITILIYYNNINSGFKYGMMWLVLIFAMKKDTFLNQLY